MDIDRQMRRIEFTSHHPLMTRSSTRVPQCLSVLPSERACDCPRSLLPKGRIISLSPPRTYHALILRSDLDLGLDRRPGATGDRAVKREGASVVCGWGSWEERGKRVYPPNAKMKRVGRLCDPWWSLKSVKTPDFISCAPNVRRAQRQPQKARRKKEDGLPGS